MKLLAEEIVLEALLNKGSLCIQHPDFVTVKELANLIPTISKRTIQRVFGLLEKDGVIKRIGWTETGGIMYYLNNPKEVHDE
jgi:predicted transcriptional regulator of viral defense system